MKDKKSYGYHLDDDLPLSESQPNRLEKDITASLGNDIDVEKLITKSSELDRQTTESKSRDYFFTLFAFFCVL